MKHSAEGEDSNWKEKENQTTGRKRDVCLEILISTKKLCSIEWLQVWSYSCDQGERNAIGI